MKLTKELKFKIKEILVPKNENEYRDLYVNTEFGSRYLNWFFKKGSDNVKLKIFNPKDIQTKKS